MSQRSKSIAVLKALLEKQETGARIESRELLLICSELN